MNNNNILIVRRQDEQPEPLKDDTLHRDAQEPEIETSATARMFAVLLLGIPVAAGAGIMGLIASLLQQ